MGSEVIDRPGDVRVDVLGPLQLIVEGAQVEVPGPKRRALLALLAMAEGRAVSVDTLIDALWPSDIPVSARATLQSHVSRLRGHLGSRSSRLEGLDGGYRLKLSQDESDAGRARALLEDGRELATVDAAAACDKLREARRLWRGAVLADLRDLDPVSAWTTSLDQLRREVDELFVSCALDAGQTADAYEVASRAVADDPLRESAALLMVRALAVSGRSADALRAAREFRRRLAEDAGLDPSPALAELETSIAGSATRRSGVVPRPATKLFGRETELATLHRLLTHERLVTVVGPGGVGKTRLALEAARRAEHATALLLASVTDPSTIPHALANALDLRVVHGDVLTACISLLCTAPHLLLFDNCEHLVDGVRDVVSTLIARCPELTVLATSREPLGLPVECTSRLAPLALPSVGTTENIERLPSVAIFIDRAKRARPGFSPNPEDLQLVGEIVRRLDGMPLAIELAAGRMSSFGLADLLERVGRSLDLLGDGRPPADSRHKTLRTTIEWSYDLLPDHEQRLFRHLSVFPDGVDLSTAERVAAELTISGDAAVALGHLVDASMIDAHLEGAPRYRMLEMLRSFGLDQLEAHAEREEATVRLVQWAVDLAAWVNATQRTEREPEADAALRAELPNLRAAWRAARSMNRIDDAISLATDVEETATWRDLTELWGWAQELVNEGVVDGHPRAASVLAIASINALTAGDLAEADRLVQQGLRIEKGREDQWWCLSALALTELAQARFTEATDHGLEAARLSSYPDQNLGIAAVAAAYGGRLDLAREINARLGAKARAPTVIATYEYSAGEIESAAGNLDVAERHYARAIDLAQTSGSNFLIGIASVGRMTVIRQMGRIDEALRGYRELVDYWDRTNGWIQQWTTLRNLAHLLRTLGDGASALFLEIAADKAPDGPGVGETPEAETSPEALLSDEHISRIRTEAEGATRARVLEVARDAIDRHLSVIADA